MNASPTAPERIGPYLIQGKLGQGGMAEVFLGLNVRGTEADSFRKTVCIKRIRSEHSRDPDFVAMFKNEARVWALLDHPKIVKVFDFGEDGGAPYMVMEYVPGADLHKVLKVHRQLPFDLVYAILQDAAEALTFAHTATPDRPALVHRDISPSNFLVTPEGTVALTDFGIAKALTHDHTKTDLIKGKLHYFAPETLTSRVNDPRTDLFAVGVTAYRAVTGALPYDGDTEFLILQRIVGDERKPVHELRPDCPPELVAIIDRLLAREPAARFQSARELLEVLPAVASRSKLALGNLVRALMSDTNPLAEPPASGPSTAPVTPASGPRPISAPAPSHGAEVGHAATMPLDSAPAPVAPRAAAPGGSRRWIALAAILALAAAVGGAVVGALVIASQSDARTDVSPPDVPRTDPLVPPQAAVAPVPARGADEVAAPEPSERVPAEVAAPVEPARPGPETSPTSDEAPEAAGAGPRARESGEITVTAVPFGMIWIDGRFAGRDRVTTRLPAGRHRVAVGIDRPGPAQTVTIRANEHQRTSLRAGE